MEIKKDSVSKFIDSLDAGTVFAICDLPNSLPYDSVKTLLSRACKNGVIERIINGIYHKPRFSEFLNAFVPCDNDDVAHAIARSNGWHIIPSENACLNILGLSTQVPSKHIYISDGPYKKYSVGNTIIEFKHRVPKDFPKSELSAIVVQGIKGYISDGEYGEELIDKLIDFIPSGKKNDILEDTKNVSLKVRKVIEKVCT